MDETEFVWFDPATVIVVLGVIVIVAFLAWVWGEAKDSGNWL